MKSEIRKGTHGRHHHRGHGISVPDEHQAEDNNHPPAKPVNKAKRHARHQKEHESKKRRMKMRDKIMASLIVLAGLVTLISGSTLTADAAGIQAQKIIGIEYGVIKSDEIVDVNQSVSKIIVTAKNNNIIADKIDKIENVIPADESITRGLINCARIDICDDKNIDAGINGLVKIDRIIAPNVIGENIYAKNITDIFSA
jgi:hypothetical protein